MLGSVTDHVCRTVSIPVMLLRPQSIKLDDRKKRLINKILVPLDGSDFSKMALPIGQGLAEKLKVSMILFQMASVIPPDKYGDGISSNIAYFDYSKWNQDEEQRVRAEMIKFETELREKGIEVTSVVTSGYDAANEIIETSKKVDADLVVMSTRGWSGLERWIFGNVAEKVLRHGETPVLLVRTRAG